MVIVGGCGHVGLPLALSLADCGYRVGIDDIDATKVAFVKAGNVPFLENGADALLKRLLPTGRLELASDPSLVENTDTVMERTFWIGVYPGLSTEMLDYSADKIIEFMDAKA